MAKHDNWQTPQNLFGILDKEFKFDLDAAASPENALCPRFITQEQDALVTPWDGENVFCNPPYSMLPAFVERAFSQSYDKRVVLLIPAYTDTKYWWNNIVPYAQEIRFLVGRLRFWEDGKPGKDTARFPSAVVVFNHIAGKILLQPHVSWWDWRNECR